MTKKIHVHFLGIGGSGASAAAAIAQHQGFAVSGCDKAPNNEFTTDFSRDQLQTGHDPAHLSGVDILAITPAIRSLDPDNSELIEADKQNIRVMTWQEFMGEFLEKDKYVIAICGTHGKSTTTSMIGQMLEEAGFDPTVELGAIIPRWGNNYRLGQSKYFVTEADEFNDNFLVSHPDMTVVTTIEMDHPEYFADVSAYKASFEKFLGQTKELIVANISDPGVAEVDKLVMKHTSVTTIDYTKSDFGLKLKVFGKHNLMNATAAFQVGLALGIDPEVIRRSLENYSGIGRRLEPIGELNGAAVFSDFGHHPTEIRVTSEALHDEYPDKKIHLVFQPHMFSRTKALFKDFVQVLTDLPVDEIDILAIYPSREVDTGLVSSQELVDAINKPNVRFAGTFEDLIDELKDKLTEDDIVLMMGAGSIDEWGRGVTKNG